MRQTTSETLAARGRSKAGWAALYAWQLERDNSTPIFPPDLSTDPRRHLGAAIGAGCETSLDTGACGGARRRPYLGYLRLRAAPRRGLSVRPPGLGHLHQLRP